MKRFWIVFTDMGERAVKIAVLNRQFFLACLRYITGGKDGMRDG
jgi:hypothetical protein